MERRHVRRARDFDPDLLRITKICDIDPNIVIPDDSGVQFGTQFGNPQ
jgi:hypothetical protein